MIVRGASAPASSVPANHQIVRRAVEVAERVGDRQQAERPKSEPQFLDEVIGLVSRTPRAQEADQRVAPVEVDRFEPAWRGIG